MIYPLAEVVAEDRGERGFVGKVHPEPSVEPPRTDQRRIEISVVVAGSDDDDAIAPTDAVEALEKARDDRREPCVVVLPRAASLDGVDLVDEDDRGQILCCPLEDRSDRLRDIAQMTASAGLPLRVTRRDERDPR